MTAHGSNLVPLPDGMSEHDAGAIPEVFMTAFDAAVLQMKLRAGEVVPCGRKRGGNRGDADAKIPLMK